MSSPIRHDSKIFVAGHLGLVGSATLKTLNQSGYVNTVVRTRAELNLRDRRAVADFFKCERPEYVVLAAAKVGGILANDTYPADFLLENLEIQESVITAAQKSGVERLIFLGSSCIYPKMAEQPITEASFLSGPLEETNRPYAIAKIAGVEMCWSMNRQHSTSFLAVMPTNLYGPNDNFHSTKSHVIPGLIRRFHEAKTTGSQNVEIWGTGTPLREFLFSDDLGVACLSLLELDAKLFDQICAGDRNSGLAPILNVGSGFEISISDLAAKIAGVVGYSGGISYDSSKPDGTPRKILNSKRITDLGWSPKIGFSDGLQIAYEAFLRGTH